MHAGREADDQQPCLGVAKGKHRPGVVIGVPGSNIGKETGKAGAVGTT